ncbi:hypothetical protein Bbelb_000420 [Branchiostoma belcheri]|nr:hypothetical protein Bbelb_000420 [Branchiostoma belcheri]
MAFSEGVIDDFCNQTVDNPEDAGYVQTQTDLTDFLKVDGYDDNADCSITLVAPANRKFLIQWTQPIDFEFDDGCRDWVRVHDGYENDTSLYAQGELCVFATAEETANLTKATSGNVVTVTVHTDSNPSSNKGFKLLYTVFYEPDNAGSCSATATDYRCSNGRCVSESVKCDFQDHCGDNSDESKTLASCPDLPDVVIAFITNVLKLSVGAFIGVCVAVGLVLILIIVLCICCCCKLCGCCQTTRAAPVPSTRQSRQKKIYKTTTQQKKTV